MNRNVPVIIGQGQHVRRSKELEGAPGPVDLAAEAARRAEKDSGSSSILNQVDSVKLVNILSWVYPDPLKEFIETLGIEPEKKIYTELGGHRPQELVNETAEEIAEGDEELSLLAGGEALRTVRTAIKKGYKLPWPSRGKSWEAVSEKRDRGTRDVELKHGLRHPLAVFPLFENSLRAHYGRDLDEHMKKLGKLCEELSSKVEENQYAWFREGKGADEITTVTPENRMMSFPYPKYMTAMIDVDQSAALLMSSEKKAKELGVPEDKWIYLWGCADARDHWYITDRVNYYSSPALKKASEEALDMAGLDIQDIDYFDIYSCFPSAIQIGRDMLGIPEDDPRSLTVAGGLPYFGGPGNNYSMHAIGRMVEILREEDSERYGLVTGLGAYLMEHSVGIYSNSPKEEEWEWSRKDPALYQKEIDSMEHPPLEEKPEGKATVETYTVRFDREGKPTKGTVIGRMEDGSRFVANTPEDEELLNQMVSQEMVGVKGRVKHDSSTGKNIFSF